MTALGRAAGADDVLVSIHPRRLGIVGDGQPGDPSALVLDGKCIISNRMAAPILIKVVQSLAAAGGITLTGVQPGDTVVSVTDVNNDPHSDVSSSFESTITVANQIQQLGSTPSTHNCSFVIWARS
jgi:hypothetical protein